MTFFRVPPRRLKKAGGENMFVFWPAASSRRTVKDPVSFRDRTSRVALTLAPIAYGRGSLVPFLFDNDKEERVGFCCVQPFKLRVPFFTRLGTDLGPGEARFQIRAATLGCVPAEGSQSQCPTIF